MANGDYKNNPLYTDITQLDHLSPAPVFQYFWNKESGRWEPQGKIELIAENLDLDLEIDLTSTNAILGGIADDVSNLSGYLSGINFNVSVDSDTTTHSLLSGVSGELSNLNTFGSDKETHRLLSGVSGELSNLNIDDSETHRLLSGISGELSNIHVDVELDSDTKTHELLSGVIEKLDDVGFDTDGITIERKSAQPWKKRTKTVNQKIEEDFILMENIPENLRYGIDSGSCYGTNKNLMDDVFGTYFQNGRMNKSELEIEHPNYFIHSECTPQDRCVSAFSTFHTDTQFSLRQENVSASLINSYELEDYNNLYERGLMDHIVIFNESSYPMQFHTADRRLNKNEPVSPKNEDLIYLDTDMAVRIDNDEAGRVFIKRPHTVSGYTVKYSIVYKVTGYDDIIK